jgi:hypothetical protein
VSEVGTLEYGLTARRRSSLADLRFADANERNSTEELYLYHYDGFYSVRGPMLLPGEIAIIEAEIKRLEEARKDCRDRGIQEQIDVWIEQPICRTSKQR